MVGWWLHGFGGFYTPSVGCEVQHASSFCGALVVPSGGRPATGRGVSNKHAWGWQKHLLRSTPRYGRSLLPCRFLPETSLLWILCIAFFEALHTHNP